jgi:hypothetical protein
MTVVVVIKCWDWAEKNEEEEEHLPISIDCHDTDWSISAPIIVGPQVPFLVELVSLVLVLVGLSFFVARPLLYGTIAFELLDKGLLSGRAG